MSMIKNTYNWPDIKDGDGSWIRSYSAGNGELRYTRSGLLWNNVTARSKEGGWIQNRHESYIGTHNDFLNYQTFTDWCQNQYGYMHKDANGSFWNLDKDLMIKGNKKYSEYTCIFVPARINTLFGDKFNARGDWPLGVFWQKGLNKFRSRMSTGNSKMKHLGVFNDSLEAHRAWQKAKIERIDQLLLEDLEVRLHPQLPKVLIERRDAIQNDLNNFRQTT